MAREPKWMKVTYSMPVIPGQGIRSIPAGYDVQVIERSRSTKGEAIVRWRGKDYRVTVKALDANGPGDLYAMLNAGFRGARRG